MYAPFTGRDGYDLLNQKRAGREEKIWEWIDNRENLLIHLSVTIIRYNLN